MNPAVFDKPFFEVTLPIVATIIAGVWAMISTNNRRLDDIIHRLDRIEMKLDDHATRIVAFEERTSPVRGS